MSSFSATCSRLRQFIKENNNKGLPSSSSAAMDHRGLDAAIRQPPTTKNLLQYLDAPSVDERSAARRLPQQVEEKDAQQLTIFYDGKLLVFDDFPADKARALMDMATITTNTNTTTTVAPSTASAAAISVAVVGGRPPAAGELALAGRRSLGLHRFFEKRKDRINSQAPYHQLNGSSVISKSDHSQPHLEIMR